MKRLNNTLSGIYLLLIILMSGHSAYAETIYKYVDKQGRTVYSSQPPDEDVDRHETLKVPDTKPSEERQQEARRVHEQNLKAAETLEETRRKREEIIAEENRRKRENAIRQQQYKEPGEYINDPYEQGPYYGIPGHGIIVLPGGPSIRPPVHRPPGRPPGARPPGMLPPPRPIPGPVAPPAR